MAEESGTEPAPSPSTTTDALPAPELDDKVGPVKLKAEAPTPVEQVEEKVGPVKLKADPPAQSKNKKT